MKKLLGMTLALAMLLSLLVGCGGGNDSKSAETTTSGASDDTSSQAASAPSGDPIKIAVAGPMTGDNAEYGEGFKNAAQMMVDQWNNNGGVLERPIELIAYDDKNSSDEAASIAQKIVSEGGVVGVIGHFSSGVCMTAAPVYQQNKILEISPSASNPNYSVIGDYIFRNNTVIKPAARRILQKQQGSNCGILFPCLRPVSPPEGARHADGRHAFRRRAADAGDRTRADERAEASASG